MDVEAALRTISAYFSFYKRLKLNLYDWDEKRKVAVRNFDKLSLIHVYFFWAFASTVGIYGILRLLKEFLSPEESFKSYQVIMYVFYTLIIIISSVLTGVLIFQREIAISAINYAVKFALQCKENFKKFEQKGGKGTKSTFTDKLLKHLLPLSVFGSFCGGLISLASPVDPLQRFLVDHFPSIYYGYTAYVKIVIFFAILQCGCYIWSSVLLCFILSLLYLNVLDFSLSILNKLKSRHAGKEREENFKEASQLYSALSTLNVYVMAAFFYPCQILVTIGSAILISCNYATVKLYDFIPMPGYLLMPMVSIICGTGFALLFTKAAALYKISETYLQKWKSPYDLGKPKERYLSPGCQSQIV